MDLLPPPVSVRHGCRQARRCVDTVLLLDETTGRPTRTGAAVTEPGGLCAGCARAAWWAVHDFPARVAQLADQIVEPMRTPGLRRDPDMPRAQSTERPCELDLDADALARAIVHELAAWAAWVTDQWGYLDPAAVLEAQARRCATALHAHWDELLAAPTATYRAPGSRPLAVDTLEAWRPDPDEGVIVTRDGASAACAFLDLAHRAAVKLGHGPGKPQRQHECCPHCGAPGSVVRTEPLQPGAAAPLRCEHCHRGISEDAWDVWARLDTIATGADVTRYVAPPPGPPLRFATPTRTTESTEPAEAPTVTEGAEAAAVAPEHVESAGVAA